MLLTAHDIAEEFRVDIRTVYGWRKAGILPAPMIVRRRMLWERADIDAYKTWLQSRAAAKQAGLDADAIPRPDYASGPTRLTKPEQQTQGI